jgi:hypothetical protein
MALHDAPRRRAVRDDDIDAPPTVRFNMPSVYVTVGWVEWRGGVSPPRSLRTGREPLSSSGSQYPAVGHIEAACGSSRHRLAACPWRDTAAPSVQPHYRAFLPTTDCSVPVPRIGTLALAGISRLSFSLNIGATGSRVPQKSLIRVHAASKPDAARAGLQGSARTHPGNHYHPPGFDIVL